MRWVGFVVGISGVVGSGTSRYDICWCVGVIVREFIDELRSICIGVCGGGGSCLIALISFSIWLVLFARSWWIDFRCCSDLLISFSIVMMHLWMSSMSVVVCCRSCSVAFYMFLHMTGPCRRFLIRAVFR